MSVMGQANGAAPPFNVINPSGISGGESLSGLLNTINATKQRTMQKQMTAAQMAQDQGQFQQSQQMQQQQMNQQAQQHQDQMQLTEADMELQRQQMAQAETHRQDEIAYRNMMEQKASNAAQLQSELDALDEQYDSLEYEQRVAFQTEYMTKKAALVQELEDSQNRLVKLTQLKSVKEGLFSKNLTDPNGKSIGAEMAKAMQQQQAARIAQLDPARAALQTALEAMIFDESYGKAEKPDEPTTPDAPKKPGLLDKAGAVLDLVDNVTDPGMASGWDHNAQKTLDSAPSLENLKSNYGLNPQALDQYGKLAESMAQYVHGKATPGEVVPQIQTLLTVLDKAENSAMSNADRQALRKVAAATYRQMEESGVDVDTLDKLMWSASEMKRGSDKVAAGYEAQAQQNRMAQGKSENAKLEGVVSGPQARLVNTLLGYSYLKDEAGNRLVKGWGNDQFYDLAKGASKNTVEKGILETLQVLTQTRDPMSLLATLEDSDPTNDDEARAKGFGFVADLHPEVKKEVIRVIKQGLESFDRQSRDLGVTTQPNEALWEDPTDPLSFKRTEERASKAKVAVERTLPVEEAAKSAPGLSRIRKDRAGAKKGAREKARQKDEEASKAYRKK